MATSWFALVSSQWFGWTPAGFTTMKLDIHADGHAMAACSLCWNESWCITPLFMDEHSTHKNSHTAWCLHYLITEQNDQGTGSRQRQRVLRSNGLLSLETCFVIDFGVGNTGRCMFRWPQDWLVLPPVDKASRDELICTSHSESPTLYLLELVFRQHTQNATYASASCWTR